MRADTKAGIRKFRKKTCQAVALNHISVIEMFQQLSGLTLKAMPPRSSTL